MAIRDKHEMKREHMDDLAEAAMGEGLKAVMAFLAYKGNDQHYTQAFKAGAMLISSYSRFYASQTNRMGIEMQSERFKVERGASDNALPPATERPKAMAAGRR